MSRTFGAPLSESQLNSRASTSVNISTLYSTPKPKSSQQQQQQQQQVPPHQQHQHLLSYLSLKGYPHELTAQKLKLPTATEFATLLEFLVFQMDPALKIKVPTPSQLKKETERMTKELANRRRTTSFKTNTSLLNSVKDQKTSVNGFDEQLFLDLLQFCKHPSPPNTKFVEKSAFTPRGWPKLLSVITWFADLLRYYEFKGQKLKMELQESHEGIFFMYLHQTYSMWLSEDDEGIQRVVNEWQKNFSLKAQSIQVQIDDLTSKNQEVTKTVNTIIPRLQQRKVLETQKQDYISDVAKFESVIKELQANKLELEDAVAVDQLELSSLQSELVKIARERESLKIQIENQELRPQEVLRMNKNRAALEDEVRRSTEERDVKNNELFALENECRVEIDKMMKNVQQYNQLAMLLPVDTEDEMDEDEDGNALNSFDLIVTQEQMKDIIPPVDHIDCSQPTEQSAMEDTTQTLSFATTHFPSNPIIYHPNIDLFEANSKIKKLKDALVSSTRSMQDHAYEMNEKYESVEDMCQRQEEKIKELERTLDRERVALSSSKQDWDGEIQRIHLDIEEVEQETKSAKNNNHALYSQLAESERRIQQLQKEQQLMEEQFEAELTEMNRLLIKAATSVYQHKEFIQNNVAKVQESRAKIVASLVVDQ